MIAATQYSVCTDLVRDGVVCTVTADSLEQFLAGEGLRVLFFSGPNAVRREAHDVAVALRELLKHYAGLAVAGHVDDLSTPALQERFRVTATPCIVFVLAGEVLEVLPRVRDWADYSAAFSRYLGAVGAAAHGQGTA